MTSPQKLNAGRGGDGNHYDPNQPRVPAGDPSHHGGRWTETGGSSSAVGGWPLVGSARAQTPRSRRGVEVELPSGQRVVDPYEPAGFLRSPVRDLSAVAAAGRETGWTYGSILSVPMPEAPEAAQFYLVSRFLTHVGTGGVFDYQRSGNQLLGLMGEAIDSPQLKFTQLWWFRDVSNFNVGLFSQQAGLTRYETLSIAGMYAALFSRNRRPNEPYGLDPRTRDMIAVGFEIGESGAFGRPAALSGPRRR